MEMLFSLQIFTRNQKLRSGVFNFASQRNFKKYFKKIKSLFFCGDLNIEERD